MWRRSRDRRGIVGNGRVQFRGGWRERQGRRRLAGAGLGGCQSLQRAPQALIDLIQVDVIQISGGQVETARETLHLGLRGRRAWRRQLKFSDTKNDSLVIQHFALLPNIV